MLSLLHPEIIGLINPIPYGLIPIHLGDGEPLSLIVKAQKEIILAAKTNGGFAFYLPELPSTTVPIVSAISAFFDDQDEPLVLRTALFANDDLANDLLEILSYDEVDIYFFDEQNHEWMSFVTSLYDGGSCLMRREDINLVFFQPQMVKSIDQALTSWFGQRTQEDDERAIQAVFKSSIGSNDAVIFDMRTEANSYDGSAGFRHDALIREDPGYFQERDISACFLRSFSPENIMMNPFRKDTFKEVVDHLVLTDNVVLLVQAKDSPTTETSIKRPISKKRSTAHSQIEKAIKQINGATRYLHRETVAKLVVGGKNIDVSVGQRRIIGLVVVKELFEDEHNAYTLACSRFTGLSGGGILMDYPSFHAITHHFTSPDNFITALDAIIARTSAAGWFPLRDFLLDELLDRIEHNTGLESN